MLCKSAEDVLRMVHDRDISFIQFWFTDILGLLKSFAVTPSELEEGLIEGMGFDGSSIEGFARIEESDMIAKPDPTTFQWSPGARGTSGGPHVLRHPPAGRHPLSGRPPLCLQTAAGQGPGEGLYLFRGAGIGVFLFRRTMPRHAISGRWGAISTPVPWTWEAI